MKALKRLVELIRDFTGRARPFAQVLEDVASRVVGERAERRRCGGAARLHD